jgi:hypothetical protein
MTVLNKKLFELAKYLIDDIYVEHGGFFPLSYLKVEKIIKHTECEPYNDNGDFDLREEIYKAMRYLGFLPKKDDDEFD